MDARSLFAVLALALILWLIRAWLKYDLQTQKAMNARSQLEQRLSSAAFIDRVRPSVQSSAGMDEPARAGVAPKETSRKKNNDESIEFTPRQLNQSITEAGEIRRLESHLKQLSTELEQARLQLSESQLQKSSSKDDNAGLQSTVEKLTIQLSAQQQQLQQQVRAVGQLEDVKKQMADKRLELDQVKQANVRTEDSLSRFSGGAEESAILEKKYSALRAHSKRLDSELARLRYEVKSRDSQIQQLRKHADNARSTIQPSLNDTTSGTVSLGAKRDQLRRAIEDTERSAAQAGQSDLEIRRLKGELESLSIESPISADRIDGIQRRLLEQVAVLATFSTASVKATVPDPSAAKSVANDAAVEPLYSAPTHKDDLKKIKGIGPVMEKMLNDLGVTTFEQLAVFTREDVDRVAAAIDTFPGRIERDEWVAKARIQHQQKYGESV